jgi:hypothetical protein
MTYVSKWLRMHRLQRFESGVIREAIDQTPYSVHGDRASHLDKSSSSAEKLPMPAADFLASRVEIDVAKEF